MVFFPPLIDSGLVYFVVLAAPLVVTIGACLDRKVRFKLAALGFSVRGVVDVGVDLLCGINIV